MTVTSEPNIPPSPAVGEQGSDIVAPEQYGLPKLSACLKLSHLDMNLPRLYATRWILCFPLASGYNRAQIYESLRVGLAHTISALPWIAGDIGLEEGSDPIDNRIQIVDSIGGVKFLNEDRVGALPSYGELKKDRVPLSKLSTAQLSPLGIMPEPSQQPVMAAQANFIEGGLLLSIGAHHSVCDASAFDTIINTWARNTAAAGISNPVEVVEPISNDRSILMKAIPGANPADFPEYALSPTQGTAADLNSHQTAAAPIPFELPPMESKIFYFSPESLAELKVSAAAYSTNDALCAFLWRHITLARNPPGVDPTTNSEAEEKNSALLYSVNIRSRAIPPLPANYPGNASLAGMTDRLKIPTLTAKESGLKDAAASIRKSLQKFDTPDCVPLTIGFINSRPNPTDYKIAYHGFLGPDISATSWADIHVYEGFWGEALGKPEFFRMPGEGADGGTVIFPRLPLKEGGGLEVMVGLECGAMERLLKDEEFVKNAKLWA